MQRPEKQKKKILVMVDWFSPGYKAGGPIQSARNFAYAMRRDYEIAVLTSDTDHGETDPYPGIRSNTWDHKKFDGFSVYYAQKKSISRAQLKQILLDAQADYVYLNHLFSPWFVLYPLWLKYRGILKSKIVLCPRGALYASALSVKRYKKTPFLKVFRFLNMPEKITFHATNEREKNAIAEHFPGSKIIIADNLPASEQLPLATCIKSAGMLKCIFLARIVSIKNLLFLLDVLKEIQGNVQLTVVGPVEEKDYWQSCLNKIETLPQNIRVDYAGAKQNAELPALLKEHHLFVLPTTGENFGHSIFESLLSGRPVLISDQTPWLELEKKQSGWDLPLSKPEKFREALETAVNWNQVQFDQWSQAAWNYAAAFLNNPELHQQYHQLFP